VFYQFIPLDLRPKNQDGGKVHEIYYLKEKWQFLVAILRATILTKNIESI
jgi:hypothetical protein